MSTEWFQGRSVDEQMARFYWGRVSALAVIGAAVLAMILYPMRAAAEPLFQAGDANIKITLHSEPCALKEYVSNLPQRATWEEKGKQFEGCWGHNRGLVIFYFHEDRSVGHAPATAFERVIGV